MQIERLVQMVFYIVDRKRVTAKELADFFHVSARTIYRDINILSIAGIPVISEKGAGGGISFIDGYTMDKALLSKDEQVSICQGLQILQAAKHPDAEMALYKIRSVFKNVLEPKWLDIDFSDWGSDETEKIKISDLQYAILNKHAVSFDYFNSELKQTERIVEPLRLFFKSHAWYMLGFCRSKGEIRTFRLSRVKRLLVLPEVFEREFPVEAASTEECREECPDPVLKLKFSPEIAYRLYDEFQENQVCLCEDGNYYVTAPYELNHWTMHYLLSFGKYVEVIGPEEARAMLKEIVSEILKKYT